MPPLPHPYRQLASTPGYPQIFWTRFASALSSWIDFTLIFILLIGKFGASGIQIGVASSMIWLPTLLFGPKLGSLADRYPVGRILGATLLIRTISLTLLLSSTTIHLFLVAVLLRAASNLGGGVLPLAVRYVVPEQLLADHARLSVSVDQGTRLVSPLLAAALAYIPDPQSGFLFSVGLLMLSVISARRLSRFVSATAAQSSTSPLQHAKSDSAHASAWASVRASPELSRVLWLCGTFTFVIGFLDPVVPIMLQTLPNGPESFGLVMGATALGALVGAHLTPRLRASNSDLQMISVALLAASALVATAGGWILSGASVHVWHIALWWSSLAMCNGSMLTCFQVAIQKHAPPGQIGAVSARMQNTRLLAYVVAPLIGAATVRAIGMGASVAAVACIAGCGGFLFGRRR